MSAHELSTRERKAMQHATAADTRMPLHRGSRNHYVAAKDSEADCMWQRLVSIGYAICHGSNELTGGGVCYSVTREGCAAIGLSKAATVRACGTHAEQNAQRETRNRQRAARMERRRLLAEGAALAAIREAKRAVAKARRAVDRASWMDLPDKSMETIERRMDEAVSQ